MTRTFFRQLSYIIWSPTESVNLLTDHMSMAIILNPLKINLRWTMKNGNLAPTLRALCLCMRWQGDTRSAPLATYCFCGINTIHLLRLWILRPERGGTYAWLVILHVYRLYIVSCLLNEVVYPGLLHFSCLFHLSLFFFFFEGRETVRNGRSSLPTDISSYFPKQFVLCFIASCHR